MFLVQAEAAPAPAGDPDAVLGLDHLVVETGRPERAVTLYGARLGLDLRLDRTHEAFGSRMLFFRCGDAVVEVVAKLAGADPDARDRIGGLAWRVADVDAAHARCAAARLGVSEARTGRKPGTRVFTVRNAPASVPTLVIGPA